MISFYVVNYTEFNTTIIGQGGVYIYNLFIPRKTKNPVAWTKVLLELQPHYELDFQMPKLVTKKIPGLLVLCPINTVC